MVLQSFSPSHRLPMSPISMTLLAALAGKSTGRKGKSCFLKWNLFPWGQRTEWGQEDSCARCLSLLETGPSPWGSGNAVEESGGLVHGRSTHLGFGEGSSGRWQPTGGMWAWDHMSEVPEIPPRSQSACRHLPPAGMRGRNKVVGSPSSP